MTAAQSSLSRQSPSSLPPLTSVQLALGRYAGNSHSEPNGVPVPTSRLAPTTAREHVAALPHVVDTISDFLDVAHPHIWTLPCACEKNLLHLAQRLGARLLPQSDEGGDSDSHNSHSYSDSNYPRETRLDPHYWSWQCSQALVSAVTHDNLDMVAWIHDYCPRVLPFAAMVKAARRGNVRLLQWLECRHPDAPWVPQMMDAAATAGELETLKWLHAHPKSVGCSDKMMSSAIKGGHLETVKWMHEHTSVALPLYLYKALDGIKTGHADVWLFLLDHAERYGFPATDGCVVAATAGDLERLQWMVAKIPADDLDSCIRAIVRTAAKAGHQHVVQWLHEHYSDAFTAEAMDNAAASGNLELVQWFHEHRTEGCTTGAMDWAAKAGHLNVVQWLHERRTEGCTTKAMDWAAMRGHLNIVQYLHEHRTEGCTTGAMNYAAWKGHLGIVQYLHEHRTEGCTTGAMDSAAPSGHLEIVQWLHEHRTEGCTTFAMNTAASKGHLSIVKYLHEHRTEGCTTKAMDDAAVNGHLDVVQYLHEHRTEGCTTKAMDSAAIEGHLNIVQWLHENRNEGCTTRAMNWAAMNGHLGIVQYLHEHRHMSYSSAAMHVAAEHVHFDVLLFLHANRSEDIAPGVLASTDLGIRHLEIVQWLERTHPDAIDLDVMRARNPEMAAVLAYALGSRA